MGAGTASRNRTIAAQQRTNPVLSDPIFRAAHRLIGPRVGSKSSRTHSSGSRPMRSCKISRPGSPTPNSQERKCAHAAANRKENRQLHRRGPNSATILRMFPTLRRRLRLTYGIPSDGDNATRTRATPDSRKKRSHGLHRSAPSKPIIATLIVR